MTELTQRETEVAGLVAEGLRNKEIAARLSISTPTVASHVQEAMRKAGCTGRVQLAVWWATGLRQPSSSTLAKARGVLRDAMERTAS